MKKSLRIALSVSIIAFALAVNLVPAIWNLNFLPGWPRFLSTLLLPLSFYSALLLYFLPKEKNKKRKWLTVIAWVALILVRGGFIASDSFKNLKVTGYIHSPNGVNTAVVMESAVKLSFVQPLRARFFYVETARNGVYLEEGLAQAAYTWADENTLVFTEGYRENTYDFDAHERYTTKELHW